MIDPSPPRTARRPGAAWLLGVVLLLAPTLSGCGDDGDAGARSPADPATTSSVVPDDGDDGDDAAADEDDTGSPALDGPADPSIDCPTPEGDLAAFGADVVVVVADDGSSSERCVLVADSSGSRAQGLMGVTDLGPYDAMVFAYAGTSSGGYWMKDTPMPLTIAWIGLEGEVVATADMAPCLDRGPDCPSYEPGAAYRWAVEVPQGELDAFGLTGGASLDVGSLPVGLD